MLSGLPLVDDRVESVASFQAAAPRRLL